MELEPLAKVVEPDGLDANANKPRLWVEGSICGYEEISLFSCFLPVCRAVLLLGERTAER